MGDSSELDNTLFAGIVLCCVATTAGALVSVLIIAVGSGIIVDEESGIVVEEVSGTFYVSDTVVIFVSSGIDGSSDSFKTNFDKST